MITIIVCFIIDLSGIQYSVKKLIWKWLRGNKEYQDFELKPLTCSLCMSHHTMVIFLLCIGQFTLFNYMCVCLLALFSSNISGMLVTIKDFLIKIEQLLNNLISKI